MKANEKPTYDLKDYVTDILEDFSARNIPLQVQWYIACDIQASIMQAILFQNLEIKTRLKNKET